MWQFAVREEEKEGQFKRGGDRKAITDVRILAEHLAELHVVDAEP